MTDWIVAMLNALGAGVSDSALSTLLKTPQDYNKALYDVSFTVANTAVKPIAATVLAIVFTLELARVGAQVDGDRQLGVKMVATAMFKIALVYIAAVNAPLFLKAINEIGTSIISGFSKSLSSSGADAVKLGDEAHDAIAGMHGMEQAGAFAILLIPFLVSQGVAIAVNVVVALRFMQLYVMTAFNPLPIAFIAHQDTRAWGIGYFKSYAVVVFQSVTLFFTFYLYRVLVKTAVAVPKASSDIGISWFIDNFTGLIGSSVLLLCAIFMSNSVAKRLFGGE